MNDESKEKYSLFSEKHREKYPAEYNRADPSVGNPRYDALFNKRSRVVPIIIEATGGISPHTRAHSNATNNLKPFLKTKDGVRLRVPS